MLCLLPLRCVIYIIERRSEQPHAPHQTLSARSSNYSQRWTARGREQLAVSTPIRVLIRTLHFHIIIGQAEKNMIIFETGRCTKAPR